MKNKSKEEEIVSARDRNNFRQTKAWKDFRAFCKKLCGGKDYLTGSRLTAKFNLHHLDQRHEHYKDIEDPDRFICLNQQSHDAIHWLYRIWIKDPNVLDRIEEVLNRMKEYSND